jgi:hypothetical protein
MTEFQEHSQNKIIALAAFSLILLFSSCRSLETIDSKWLSVPEDSRGQMENFAKNITSHLYENGLLVGVGNDEKYLYILFSPDIRHQTRPPSRALLTLWLDRNGKKARKYGFVYTRTYFPEGMDGTRPEGPSAQPGHGDAGMRKPPAVIEPLLQFVDKSGNKRTYLPSDGSQGPQIHFSSDWGDFVYTWRIPLNEETKENYFALAAKPGQAIGIGLLWKIKPLLDSKKPDGMPGEGIDGPPGGGGGMGGPPGGGMGGPPGGGMGRGGAEPGNDFNQLSTSRKIWLKIILAQNKNAGK